MNILVFNAGSSSLKFSLFDASGELAAGQIDWAGGDRHAAILTLDRASAPRHRETVTVPDDAAAAQCVLEALTCAGARELMRDIGVVGHRVVHGGTAFGEAKRIDSEVIEAIARHCRVAPLHNPPALAVIQYCQQALPRALQVAVFDTAFFANLPPRAYVYPLPYEWHTQQQIRRFGFHGISHQYCVNRAAELIGKDRKALRIVSCHLGGGCSAAAIVGGIPVASTMGFSPLDGLMMGTRCGSIDPGILLHLQRERGMSLQEMDAALNYRSGLLGISGVSPDMAQVEKAAQAGNARAQLAFDLFVDRLRSAIAAMTVTMGGIDGLLFTDRVGENVAVRAAACEGLACLGVRLDPRRNENCVPDMDVAAEDSAARILVIRTREELMIAREAAKLAGAVIP